MFNSTLERDFAFFLDGGLLRYKGVNYYHKPIKWEYESKEFELIPQEDWFDRTEKDKTLKRILRNKKHTFICLNMICWLKQRVKCLMMGYSI